ncbi:MAG: glycosyltransferase [Saprospiraceae bacterium]
MKVSILIPVYNAERYLEECIVSALNQTNRDIEIIAINDGSTDGSLSILEKYSGQIQIINKAQGGVASARNAGIKIATGDWIKLLDNDDVLYLDAITEMLNEAGKIDIENKILYSNVDYIDAAGKVIGHLIEPNYNKLDDFERNTILLDHNIGIPSTWLIHKSVIEHCGLFDEITEHDDYEYHLRACLLHHCQFHLVEKKTVRYRFHAQQFTWQVMRKFQNQDVVVAGILAKLDGDERKKYQNALIRLRANRSLFEKTAHWIKPILKYMPIKLEIWLRTIYLQIAEYQKSRSKNKNTFEINQ